MMIVGVQVLKESSLSGGNMLFKSGLYNIKRISKFQIKTAINNKINKITSS